MSDKPESHIFQIVNLWVHKQGHILCIYIYIKLYIYILSYIYIVLNYIYIYIVTPPVALERLAPQQLGIGLGQIRRTVPLAVKVGLEKNRGRVCLGEHTLAQNLPRTLKNTFHSFQEPL